MTQAQTTIHAGDGRTCAAECARLKVQLHLALDALESIALSHGSSSLPGYAMQALRAVERAG